MSENESPSPIQQSARRSIHDPTPHSGSVPSHRSNHLHHHRVQVQGWHTPSKHLTAQQRHPFKLATKRTRVDLEAGAKTATSSNAGYAHRHCTSTALLALGELTINSTRQSPPRAASKWTNTFLPTYINRDGSASFYSALLSCRASSWLPR